MNNYRRLSAKAEGELADNTITRPIESNNNIVITNVKSIGLFKKRENVFSFFFFAILIYLSFLKQSLILKYTMLK